MKSLILALVTVASVQAQAVINPMWERPIQTAEMKVKEARFGFQKVKSMTLTLTKRDGSQQPTGLVLTYKTGSDVAKHQLVLVNTETDSCGSVKYAFRLPQLGQPELSGMEARLSVTLIDHSQRICENVVPYLWEAKVRMGYGFCGTMDATASLYGNPEAVYTIQ